MSYSAYAYTIVGIPLKEIYSYEIKTDKKKKFNEDSGEPYFVSVSRLYAKFGNEELPPVDAQEQRNSWSYEQQFYQNWDFLEAGIEVHIRSCLSSFPAKTYERGILGIQVCKDLSYEDGLPKSVSLQEIYRACDRMKVFLEKYGCKSEVQIFSLADGG